MGDDYVVAVVTEIDNEDYTPIEKVANNIRQTLITDKKFEKIVSEMKGSTIEEVAQTLVPKSFLSKMSVTDRSLSVTWVSSLV